MEYSEDELSAGYLAILIMATFSINEDVINLMTDIAEFE